MKIVVHMIKNAKCIATIISDMITTDIGERDTIYPISSAARERQGENPAMEAAEQLNEVVDNGDTVLVLTGFLIPPSIVQETDGPVGAVSVARALNANAIIACKPTAVDIREATATAGELGVLDRDVASGTTRSVSVEAFPADRNSARTYVEELLAEVNSSAVVAVDKIAQTTEGVYNNIAGYEVSEKTAEFDVLYDEIPDETLTISVLDAGNEITMGLIQDLVQDEINYRTEYQCEYNAGIAADMETDLLVPATVSNCDDHAITACLSHVTGTAALYEPTVEQRMLEQAAMAGNVDKSIGRTNAWCDGTPPAAHESILHLVREVMIFLSTLVVAGSRVNNT